MPNPFDPKAWTISCAAALLLLGACHRSAQPTTPPPPELPPPPPPSPLVSITDLIAPESSGALHVDVAALRTSEHGRGLIEALGRLAQTDDLEQVLEVDVSENVDAFLFFAQADESVSGDLTHILRRQDAQMMGFVFEMSSSSNVSSAECREDDLAQVVFEPIGAGPMANARVGRCGRFLIVQNGPDGGFLTTRGGSRASRELEQAREREGASSAVLVIGPEGLSRASCDQASGEIPLTGWQSVTLALAGGLRAMGRVHVARSSDAPVLRECISDAVSTLANFPLLAQLGLTSILTSVEVRLDEADEKDVLVEVVLDEGQTERLMMLIGLMEDGGLQ